MLLGLVGATAGEHELLGRPDAAARPATCCRGSARWSRAPRSTPTSTAATTCCGSTRATARCRARGAGERVDAALERVGLTAAAGKRYRKYSLGMRQRLGLAAALLRPRELLVLDEPTNGLDPQGTREVRHLVREASGGGRDGLRLVAPAQRDRADLHPRRA